MHCIQLEGPVQLGSNLQHWVLLRHIAECCARDCKLTLDSAVCRDMPWMPVESELVTLTGSSDIGAGRGAVALVMQEACRSHRHRQVVKVCPATTPAFPPLLHQVSLVLLYAVSFTCCTIPTCTVTQRPCPCGRYAKMRCLPNSGKHASTAGTLLWRRIFLKWVGRAREQLRARQEAAAVVAMKERRRRYQADGQPRLAWVEEGLAQSVMEDSTCPVCSADAGRAESGVLLA